MPGHIARAILIEVQTAAVLRPLIFPVAAPEINAKLAISGLDPETHSVSKQNTGHSNISSMPQAGITSDIKLTIHGGNGTGSASTPATE